MAGNTKKKCTGTVAGALSYILFEIEKSIDSHPLFLKAILACYHLLFLFALA